MLCERPESVYMGRILVAEFLENRFGRYKSVLRVSSLSGGCRLNKRKMLQAVMPCGTAPLRGWASAHRCLFHNPALCVLT